MRSLSLLSAFFVSAVAVVPAFANSIPYSQVGTVAPTVLAYAAGNNGVDVYYAGSTAGYSDSFEVYDVKTGYNSGPILNNKSTAVGTEVVVGDVAGEINAGDQLIFYVVSPEGLFGSIAADSPDGINHAYITTYSGGIVNNVTVPAGLFVGLEDENKSHSDLNYNDDDVLVTGATTTVPTSATTAAVTPEPASLLLLATGLLGGGAVALRRRSVA